MHIRSDIDSAKPSARSEFARRLRELRVPRGFRTARSLAKALEIDENRYTRYERAEVEPDLAMIRRICEILNVTANDLLGTPGGNGASSSGQPASNGHARSFAGNHRAAPEPIDIGTAAAAWALAEAVAKMRLATGAHMNGKDSPLADVGATGRLYHVIMLQPFEAINGFLADPAIAGAPADRARDLRERIELLIRKLQEKGV